MIGMRVRGDKIIQSLNFVALQRIQHDLAFAGIARIDQNGLARGRYDQNGIALDRADIEHVNLQFAGRLRGA